MNEETIGQKILATLISARLGISMDRAMKQYVAKTTVHPSWERLGEELLRKSAGGSVPPSDFPGAQVLQDVEETLLTAQERVRCGLNKPERSN